MTTDYTKPLPIPGGSRGATTAEFTKPFWEATKRHELVMPRCKTHDGFFVGFTNFDVEHKDSSLHPSTDKQWWMDLLSTFLFQHDFNARFTQFVLLPNGCV